MQVFFFSWKCHILYEGKNTWNQPIQIMIIILTAPNWIILFFRNGIIQMSFFKELWKNIFCFQGSWVLGPSIANYHTQLEGEQDKQLLNWSLYYEKLKIKKYNSQCCPEKMIFLNSTTIEQASKKTLLPFRQVGRTDQTLSFSSILQVIIGQKSRKSVENSNHEAIQWIIASIFEW